MSAKVTDRSVLLEQEIARNASLGLRFVAEAIVASAEPNTPKKRGNLRRDVLKQVLVWRVGSDFTVRLRDNGACRLLRLLFCVLVMSRD